MKIRLREWFLLFSGAVIAIAVQQLGSPQAFAQSDTDCGTSATARPCDLVGYKLFTNQNRPALMILQIETKQGPKTFVASRLSMERFAKELLQSVANTRGQSL